MVYYYCYFSMTRIRARRLPVDHITESAMLLLLEEEDEVMKCCHWFRGNSVTVGE